MGRLKRVWRSVLLGVALLIAYLLWWPVRIEPAVWNPPRAPTLDGPFAPNTALSSAESLGELGPGPEDVALGPDGALYTGLRDGRVVRFTPGEPPETVVQTGGRPLGLMFDDDGRIIVADARRGLMRVENGMAAVLAGPAASKDKLFADDLDIAADGTIWFSVASEHFDVEQAVLDALDNRPTGRLLSYDPVAEQTQVHLTGLRFANGVAVGPDQSYVLVSETFGYRITRLYLTGPRKGETDVLTENLPGLPDNINFDPHGRLWVALVKLRSGLLDRLLPEPFWRKVIARLPAFFLPVPDPYGFVVALDESGGVLHNLHDPSGAFGDLTSATPIGDHLVLGSLTATAAARVPLPAVDP